MPSLSDLDTRFVPRRLPHGAFDTLLSPNPVPVHPTVAIPSLPATHTHASIGESYLGSAGSGVPVDHGHHTKRSRDEREWEEEGEDEVEPKDDDEMQPAKVRKGRGRNKSGGYVASNLAHIDADATSRYPLPAWSTLLPGQKIVHPPPHAFPGPIVLAAGPKAESRASRVSTVQESDWVRPIKVGGRRASLKPAPTSKVLARVASGAGGLQRRFSVPNLPANTMGAISAEYEVESSAGHVTPAPTAPAIVTLNGGVAPYQSHYTYPAHLAADTAPFNLPLSPSQPYPSIQAPLAPLPTPAPAPSPAPPHPATATATATATMTTYPPAYHAPPYTWYMPSLDRRWSSPHIVSGLSHLEHPPTYPLPTSQPSDIDSGPQISMDHPADAAFPSSTNHTPQYITPLRNGTAHFVPPATIDPSMFLRHRQGARPSSDPSPTLQSGESPIDRQTASSAPPSQVAAEWLVR